MPERFNLGDEIVTGTRDVFSTMLMVDLAGEEIVENKKCDIRSNLTSMIGLGGGIRGLLAVHCSASAAKAITSAFIGMNVEELDDDVKDAIGEIANMVAGNLKVSFAKIDTGIELAVPTSVMGESFHVGAINDARRITVLFTMGEDIFWVELMYVVNA